MFDEIIHDEDIDVLVIAARWESSDVESGSFERLLEILQDRGLADQTLIIERQAYFSHAVANQAITWLRTMDPEIWDPVALNLMINETVIVSDPQLPARDIRMAELSELYGVAFVSAFELQRAGDGIEFISPQGELLYWDVGHLTTAGSERRVRQMLDQDQVSELFRGHDLTPRSR